MQRLLKESCLSKCPIEIIYMSNNGQFTQRFIIVNEIKDNCITALCLLRNEKRTFKIDNILSCSFKQRQKGLAQ